MRNTYRAINPVILAVVTLTSMSPLVVRQAPAPAQTQAQCQSQSSGQPQASAAPSGPLQQRITPGLATLTDDLLFGDVWKRPELPSFTSVCVNWRFWSYEFSISVPGSAIARSSWSTCWMCVTSG